MIVIISALLGAIVGFWSAKKRRGNAMDIAQYVVGHTIAFTLVGVVATLIIHRLAV